MEDDWDLHAVVRSCSSSSATTAAVAAVSTTAGTAIPGSRNLSNSEQDCNFSWFKDPFEARKSSSVEDLHELWKPFCPKQQVSPITPPSPKQQQQTQQKQQPFSLINGSNSKPSSTSHHPTPRSKKRKHHSKKVCHVAAENLSSDMWSWRKYGQKPIKGSPYPRGYYRCSTSKGCMARKQVERNRSDPNMFIVTYTGDHTHPMPTHRNSLAGCSRQKPSPPPPPPQVEESSSDDDADDFFAGLEDFAPDFVSESEHRQFPWMSNNAAAAAAATAAGGG